MTPSSKLFDNFPTSDLVYSNSDGVACISAREVWEQDSIFTVFGGTGLSGVTRGFVHTNASLVGEIIIF